MTRTAFLFCTLLASCLFSSCGGDISGTYVFAAEASLDKSDLTTVDPDAVSMITQLLESLSSEVTISDDSTYELWGENTWQEDERNESKGTWDQDGDAVTLHQTHSQGAEKTDSHVMTLDGDTLTITVQALESPTYYMVYEKR